MSEREQKGCLAELLKDPNVYEFYQSLPSYVQEMISDRGEDLHSEKELRRYAENLVQGDK